MRDADILRSFEHGNRHPQRNIRDDDAPISSGSEHEPGGPVKLDRGDVAVAGVELVLQFSRPCAPDLYRTISASCDSELAVGGERHCIDGLSDIAQVLDPVAARD